jgi:hypothetical protein
MGRVGLQDRSAGADDLLGVAVVHIGRGEQRDPTVAVFEVVPAEDRWQNARASWMQPNRSGKVGWCLRVLNWLSEYRLSSETCGRAWLLVTPRSASSMATGLELIEAPRSAWMVSRPGSTPLSLQLQIGCYDQRGLVVC